VDVILFLFLIILGIGISFIVSMVGLGGGIFFIPLFIIIFFFDADVAVGTSIFCMILTNLSATIGYYRHGCVNFKLGLAYDVFDIPGIILGAWITTILPTIVLEIICGIAVIILALTVILKKNKKIPKPSLGTCEETADFEKNKTNNIIHRFNFSFAWSGQNIKWVIISSFLGGLITGMAGLGGGTVDTTTMIIIGVPVHIANGSSSFAMLLTNIFGAGSHIFLGNVNWDFAIPVGIGALVGAQIGSRLATKINPGILRKILGIIALFTGLRLIFG